MRAKGGMRYFIITRDDELRGLGYVDTTVRSRIQGQRYLALGPTSGVNLKRLVADEFGENYKRRSVHKAEWETLREICDVPVYEVRIDRARPELSRVVSS